MDEVLAHDLQPHHFLQRRTGDLSPEPLPGEVYGWMLSHQRRFRSAPSMDLLRMRWPAFEVVVATDGIGPLLDQMLRLVNRRLLIQSIRHLSELADDQSRLLDAPDHVFAAARDLARAVPSTGVTKFSDALNFLALYRQKELTGETPGISLSVQWLDDLTYGLQRHEMAIIEAFLGQKKSSLCVKMCADAYFLRDQTPLFFSFEMEGQKLVERWISMCAQFEYSALKRLKLGEGDLERWEKIGEKAASSRFEKDVLVIDDERRPTDDFIYGKIEQWQPDFSVVDTIDEVRAPIHIRSHWERQDHVARELKAIARTTRRPLVVVAQAGREAEKDGATLGNIAGSRDYRS